MILKWSELDLRSICIDRGPAMTLWAVQLENVAREEACQSRLFGLDHGHSHSTQTVFLLYVWKTSPPFGSLFLH